VAQHVDICDRFPTIGDHHSQIDQHQAPIMNRPPTRPTAPGSDRPVGQHPQQRHTGMRHHT
jgi:hypothetical protein